MRRVLEIAAIALAVGGVTAPPPASGEGVSVFDDFPVGFPAPRVPADNPLTREKIELGRHLFFDRRLSMDGTFSCSTCHQPAHAFTDSRPRAVGVTGEVHHRGSMSLANVAYNASLTWSDPQISRLEEQMKIPMFSIDPVEMGITGYESEVLERLHREPKYGPLFEQAFPEKVEPITFEHIGLAIASFERTLISGSSGYDRYVFWDDQDEFSEAARRGMDLFFSTGLRCSECHGGFNFSGPVVWEGSPSAEPVFHNTALYDLDSGGSYPESDQGLLRHTGAESDMGRFRAPTLRNIALTAPYMHDGSLSSLEEVMAHYAAGGRASGNRWKSERLNGFALSPQETSDLVSFLESLTDRQFLFDPRFTDPWSTP